MTLLDRFIPIAKEYIWANQHIDRNAIFRTKLITSITGDRYRWISPTLSTHMPDYPERANPRSYVLFEVGGLGRETMGVDSGVNLANWISLDELITVSKVFGNVISGYRMMNIKYCYLRMSEKGLIILAVDREYNKEFLSSNADVYLRLYSNTDTNEIGYAEYYNFDSSIAATEYDYYATTIDNTISMAFMNGYYVPNGFFVNYNAVSQRPVTMQYYTDPEIINRVIVSKEDFLIITHEGTEYYLICSNEDSDKMYCDDLEYFITADYTHPINELGGRIGLYIPRVDVMSINQLTFKDWVIKKSEWDAIQNTLTANIQGNYSNFAVEVVVRRSGNNFQMIQDSVRSTDIMNLPVDIRKEVFLNEEPLVDFWRADNIISSSWFSFMNCKERELTPLKHYGICSSYGASEIFERVRWNPYEESYQLPVIDHDSGWLLRFNSGLKDAEDVYTGTASSQLLYLNGSGAELWIPNVNYNDPLDVIVPPGDTTTTVPSGFGIFCYYAENNNLHHSVYELDYLYEDDQLIPTDTIITWEPHMYDKTRYIRLANRIVKYSKVLTSADISDGWDIYNGRDYEHDVGMGKLLIWYKGRYLIEKLDYLLMNGKVHLTSKHEWQITGTETVEVIYAGLPHSSLTHVCEKEWGFIANGKISYDNRYDLYNNRMKMIVGNGLVIDPDDFYTEENYEEINATPLDSEIFPNGTPYALVSLPIFNRVEELEIFSIPAHDDRIIDDRIETFLSTIYPQAEDNSPIIIRSKYDLYSPFINKVVLEILATNLVIANNSYTDAQIDVMVEPYKYLLLVDPTSNGHLDLSFIDIHPIRGIDPVQVSAFDFWFVQQLNRIYLSNKVKYINRYLQITV